LPGQEESDVRVSELAERSGVPIATIKYYLREGLLPPGHATSRTGASYDRGHLARLRVLRILREVGDVPIDRLRAIVVALERDEGDVHDVLCEATDALAPTPVRPPSEAARQQADDLIAGAGWSGVRPEAADRVGLASALDVVAATGMDRRGLDVLTTYVEVADRLGALDVATLEATTDRAGVLRQMVVGEVVFGRILGSLRRLAEEHHSSRRFVR
jgi:DNA-binding transcriptional MerR regulator